MLTEVSSPNFFADRIHHGSEAFRLKQGGPHDADPKGIYCFLNNLVLFDPVDPVEGGKQLSVDKSSPFA